MTRLGKPPFPTAALVVDDDGDMCRILELALTGAGWITTTAGSAALAIARCRDRHFQIAFVDARLPDMDGWRLIEELRQRRPEIRPVMISGYYFEDDVRVARALQTSEIHGFIAKPFRIEAVVAMATGLGVSGHRRPTESGEDARLGSQSPLIGSPIRTVTH